MLSFLTGMVFLAPFVLVLGTRHAAAPLTWIRFFDSTTEQNPNRQVCDLFLQSICISVMTGRYNKAHLQVAETGDDTISYFTNNLLF